ncbi:hypothetical protein EZS27_016495 [termite gut metagenome]|uniref:Transposase n=1 Tax=termite gut metagenome TaxID=433724 RepID=A0A5J4RQP5_9ZZZZ
MRDHGELSDALRLEIIKDHLCGSKYSLVVKYKLGDSKCIIRWMRTFGITETEEHAVEEPFMKKRKAEANKSSEFLALEKENKLLKTRFAYSELKAEAYNTMIDFLSYSQIGLQKKV